MSGLTKDRFSSLWHDDAGRVYLEYSYPLRADMNATLILPRNLSRTEVRRLAAFLETLIDVNATAGFAP